MLLESKSANSAEMAAVPRVGKVGWQLFIGLNATLFLRPAEMIPSVENWPIYQCVILACCATAVSPLLARLRASRLARDPITVCVIGLLPAVLLSHLTHFNLYDARVETVEFAKVVIYYALLVTIVDTPQRLRKFMIWTLLFTIGLTVLALLQYHQVVQVPALAEYYEKQADELDADGGGSIVLARLCGAGIFGNPNDMARLLAIGMALCLYCTADRRFGTLRWLWLGPFLMLGYALQLTFSRGGLLALVATLGALFWGRYGWRRTALIIAAALPIMAFVYGGRQTDITTDTGTGQQRIQIWSEGFGLLAQSPVFGIGTNRYREEVGYVAHNSFLHCFTEMGLFGGILFSGAFYLAVRAPGAVNAVPGRCHPEVARISPYIRAIVVGYVVGMLSSTRSYTLTTYLVLGLAGACIALAASDRAPKINGRLVGRVALIGLAVLIAIYLYVRVSVRWS